MTFEEILSNYALPIAVMSVAVLLFVGLIKIFTKMIANKKGQEESTLSKVMSKFYIVLALAASFGAVCAYFKLFNIEFDWLEVGKQTAAVYACSQSIYPLYRNYGGRWLLLKVVSACKGKSAQADEIIAILEKILPLTSSQEEAIKSTLKNEL